MDANEFIEYFEKGNKLNSLLAATIMPNPLYKLYRYTPNKATIDGELTDGLHMCNSLYLYTNPPPIGYGTPAPKVAETVNRAYEYNRKTENRTRQILDYSIEDTTIHDSRKFPYDQVAGNYMPLQTKMMAENYRNLYMSAINETITETYDWMKTSKADLMSKGRQTWDSESEKSITCAKAYSRYIEMVKKNLNSNPSTLLEFIQSFMEMMELDSLKIRKRIVVIRSKTVFEKKRKIITKVNKKRIVVKNSVIIGKDNVRKYLIDFSRSFCSYIKHKERGKKDRRAIASGNIIIRTFLKIIEEFHLKLSKKVPGNTIGIGGDQKKAKILTELKTGAALDGFNTIQVKALQGTEDATKWNECLTPSMFALVHYVFFRQDSIDSLTNKELIDGKKMLLMVSDFLFFLMSIKRIHLGPGVLIENESFYTRKSWSQYEMDELNMSTRIWLSKVKISGDNYIEASPGFLMGMLNAASTTIGLLPSNYNMIEGSKVMTLRSSDDSMSVYVGTTDSNLLSCLLQNYQNCKLLGINMSTKKTLFFGEGYGEYTSWYQDGEFVGQYGTETSSLRPSGINPQEDFNNMATQTAVLMRTQVINGMGALARLFIGITNVRRVYHISTRERENLSTGVTFLSDGGFNPWNLETLTIDESCLRRRNCKTDADLSYFYKIMNPENPFAQPPEETYMYSREEGKIVKTEYERPSNAFTYVKRSNRTVNNQTSQLEAEKEKHHKEAYKIATSIDPSLYLNPGSKKTALNIYLAANLRTMARDIELSEDQRIELTRALTKLECVEEEHENSDDGDDILNL